ncbi:MAG: hypothetical protein D6732_27715 [Methanobacteriota archaeon]|nr:MAG: hypothetical protein D6732_27715 [Euryarchaeota archaeon]
MTSSAKTHEFFRFIKKMVGELGLNSKLFAEIMDDETVLLSGRMLAVGVLLYVKSGGLLPDRWIIGLIDDIIVMVAALVIIIPLIPESRLEYYRKKYEVVNRINEYEALMISILGILWERFIQFTERLRNRTYRGKSTEEVVHSDELREDIFDETMEFIANLNIDPATIDSEFERLPSPEKIIGLLSSGLEKEQR